MPLLREVTRLFLITCAMLVCANTYAQSGVATLSERVSGDEPWQGNEATMPIAMLDDMLIVGTPAHRNAGLVNSGAVWVFVFSNGTWNQTQRLVPDQPNTGDFFGWALDVEQNTDTGEAWLVVAARDRNGFAGELLFYRLNDSTWEAQQSLSVPPPDSGGSQVFSVAINIDIPAAGQEPIWSTAIGVPFYQLPGNTFRTGAVFVSSLNSLGLWTTPALPVAFQPTFDNVNSAIGRSIDIDGNVIVAGAPFQRIGGNGGGAVWLFTRDDISLNWATFDSTVNPDPVLNMLGGAEFGHAVAVAKQLIPDRQTTGTTYIAVGAPVSRPDAIGGRTYVYEFNGTMDLTQRLLVPNTQEWGNARFGNSLAFDQDLIGGDHQLLVSLPGNGNPSQLGSVVRIFDQTDLNEPWQYVQELRLFDNAIGQLGSAAFIRDVAAWNNEWSLTTSNLVPGNDAAYAKPVIIFGNSFEQITP